MARQPKRRVLLLVRAEIGQHLVAADIERAEGHRPLAGGIEDGFVDARLLLEPREGRGDHELQLGAEEADAIGARLVEMRQIEHETGIDVERDPLAVERHRRHAAQGGVLRLTPRPEADLVGIGGDDLGRRPHMQLAALGIDDGRIAGLDRVEHALGLADGGDAERTRHDGDMARGTAFLQHQAAQALAVVVEELGRAHGAGDEDGVLRQIAGRRRADPAGQHAQQPIGEIVDIVQPLARVGIGLAQHAGARVVAHALHRGFGGQAGEQRLVRRRRQPRSWANMRKASSTSRCSPARCEIAALQHARRSCR